MKHSLDALIWVLDRDGSGYVCKASDTSVDKKDLASLSENELATCKKVSSGADRFSLENLNNLR